MPQDKTHKKCKHYDSQRCPHKKDKVMIVATQKVPEHSGGAYSVTSFPPTAEVDKICGECDAFTPHRQLDLG